MATAKEPFDGDLWFLTDMRSEKVEDLEQEPGKSCSPIPTRTGRHYVSITGHAVTIRDQDMIDELWSEPARPVVSGRPDRSEYRADPGFAEHGRVLGCALAARW